MREIGGYFELEIHKKNEYHSDAIRLNTGRNALKYIILAEGIKKIYLPYFSCEVLLEPIVSTGCEYEFYNINSSFEAIFDFFTVKEFEMVLLINYFGIKDEYLTKVARECDKIIIDNSQSFFSKPIEGINTFYSARKFFGVPDGAYLYPSKVVASILPKDNSSTLRLSHLITRHCESAEAGYVDYVENESFLSGQPLQSMSDFTRLVLSSIDFDFVARQRMMNFKFVSNELNKLNGLTGISCLPENLVPFCYPFYTNQCGIKKLLHENKIYVPTYWPNVLSWVSSTTLEYRLTSKIIAIPIDHRYKEMDIQRIVNLIKSVE